VNKYSKEAATQPPYTKQYTAAHIYNGKNENGNKLHISAH